MLIRFTLKRFFFFLLTLGACMCWVFRKSWLPGWVVLWLWASCAGNLFGPVYFYDVWLVVWKSDCHAFPVKRGCMSECGGWETVSINSCCIKGPRACYAFNPNPSCSLTAPDSTCNVDIEQRASRPQPMRGYSLELTLNTSPPHGRSEVSEARTWLVPWNGYWVWEVICV